MTNTPPLISPIDTMPLSGPEERSYFALYRSMPDVIKDLMTDMKTVDLINRIRDEYQLQDVGRVNLAEFLRDIFLGVPVGKDLADTLADRLDVNRNSALQILSLIEQELLTPVGLGYADLGRVAAGPSIRQEAGRLLLRYESLDDLLEDIKDFAPEQRSQYLQDAKTDNRILVLKALSQLKLGTDNRGRPQTFRQLAIQEAPDFSADDWADAMVEDPAVADDAAAQKALVLFLTDAGRISELAGQLTRPEAARAVHTALEQSLARAKPSVAEYVKWSPYFAGVYDKDKVINDKIFERFVRLPEETRQRLVSESMSERVGAMVQDGLIPKNYGVAVARIAFLATLGDIEPDLLPTLLGERLGLGREQGLKVAEYIVSVILAELGPEGTPAAPVQEPEEAEPAPEPTPARSANATASAKIQGTRNVIDLRAGTPKT